MNRKNWILLFIIFCLLTVNSFAFDFSLRPKGFASIPMGDGNASPGGNDMYSMGGGSDIGLDIDLSTVWPNPLGVGYTLGVEGGLIINTFLGAGDGGRNMSFYSFGSTLGLYYFPLSRLFTRVDGTVGVYQAAIGETGGDTSISKPGMFWRTGGEIGFRFTPGFTLAANAGWRQYEEPNERILNSGFYSGLTMQMTFQTGKENIEGISAALDQDGAVYPAFMQLYQKSGIGNVVIRNNENAEIRDVRLSFRADGYTASEFLCGTISVIPRGRSANLPLLADFSQEILRFTDSGRIIGEIIIRYRYLGREREAVRAVTVATYNRNRISENDVSSLAAFISPTSPETLDFARAIAEQERSNRRTGHNRNLNYAMWFLEGLRASGIQLSTRNAETEITSVQFPAETLLFRSGSSLDLALLFASGLEGVGINSAFIRAGDEFLVAVSIGVGQSAAETLFNGTEKIVVINDSVWLPLSMNAFGNGFTACWTRGISILNEAFANDKPVDFVIVENAWGTYPPAPLPELGRGVLRTDNAALTREVNRAVQQYMDQELAVILRQVQAQINTNPTAAMFNRVGILQARLGRTAEAKAAYERAAGMGSVPAMTNRGNLALIENDFTNAERWFRQALQIESDNTAALRGLQRISEVRR